MSLFGKDDKKRLADTLAFIQGIDGVAEIPRSAFVEAHRNDIELSRKISLGFRLIQDRAETERRRALRALLMLVGACSEGAIAPAKKYLQDKSQGFLVDGIMSFFPLAASDAMSVVRFIKQGTFTPKIGDEKHTQAAEFYKYTRMPLLANAKGIKGCGNCYGGAALFLYLAGVVSLTWLQKWGTQGGTAEREPFAFGPRITDPGTAADIPAGKLLYFARPYGGVHYAISIGDKNCVGHNNSAVKWPENEGPAPITTCSTFTIAGYLKACQDELVRANQPRTNAFVIAASCIPKPAYRF